MVVFVDVQNLLALDAQNTTLISFPTYKQL